MGTCGKACGRLNVPAVDAVADGYGIAAAREDKVGIAHGDIRNGRSTVSYVGDHDGLGLRLRIRRKNASKGVRQFGV